jgi:hypothetical protein
MAEDLPQYISATEGTLLHVLVVYVPADSAQVSGLRTVAKLRPVPERGNLAILAMPREQVFGYNPPSSISLRVRGSGCAQTCGHGSD